jgi:hypothetical protein
VREKEMKRERQRKRERKGDRERRMYKRRENKKAYQLNIKVPQYNTLHCTIITLFGRYVIGSTHSFSFSL